ncbi:carboxylesterase family protein [Novosphingobium flavum]|uniref:Carboxylic ester hydrolase n=1 Tax=Novosphingobium flavum TaxID=1778672 RepID=A0A7X1FTS0_9SPHN|nr:carboxylesterase family protein [Novosphingobium flavum]MBC2666835.1 carboxylesterase family protein [Novosphingobium flavum]
MRAALPAAIIAATLSIPAAAAPPEPPRITLPSGALQGTRPGDAPGAVFMGIPYAAPPTGPLRWQAPRPAQKWPGVKDAAAPGPACIQVGANGVSGSEDCLYLNVWTPRWPAQGKAPVMLWLFGGANTNGSANNPVFDGAALARQGVVVVTANFRVGVFGFMAHPALSAESPAHASGNYMLLDQLAALRWIRGNITRFGGDPGNVTLFGQSSGSYDLLLLMTSPLARGLFHKAIAQSGQFLAYDGPMPRARAEAIGRQIAADLKAPAGAVVLPFLRALPPEAVLAAARSRMSTVPGSDTGLLTSIDGHVLTEPPARIFAAGRQLAIPLIIGSNAREITRDDPLPVLRAGIAARYGDFAPAALAAYGLDGDRPGRTDPLLGSPGAQWWTDIVQRCPATVEASWHAAAGRPTFHYQFERTIPGREAQGAYHGAEVPFVFGNLDRVVGSAFGAEDRDAARQIQAYWVNFARTGNPNGAGLPEWPRAGRGAYLAFTQKGPVAAQGLQQGPCAVYRDWTLRNLK